MIERVAQRLQMLGRSAAAAADDARAGVAYHLGVFRHQLRRAVIADVAFLVVRDAAIALGHDHIAGLRGGRQLRDGDGKVGRADAAIGAVGQRLRVQLMHEGDEIGGRQAHHGPAVGVERTGGDDRQAGGRGALDGGGHFLLGGHGLDPQHVDPAFGQGAGLLGEGVGAVVDGEWTQRVIKLAGRAHGSGHDHLATLFLLRLVGDAAGDAGGLAVDLAHPVLEIVQLQPVARAAERVGQEQVRAGIDEGLMQRLDPIRMVEIPHLRRVAGHQPSREQIGAGGPIRHQEGAAVQELLEAV